LSNSEDTRAVELGSRGVGVRLTSKRGTTQTYIKVPKYQFSVKGERLFVARDSEEVGLEAAIL
jgi:hypothetical protein